MPHKPKKKPPPPSDAYVEVTLQNAEAHMSQFIKYYKGIGLVPESEWNQFMECLFRNVPVAYRIAERTRIMNNQYEGRPGTLTEAEVLREFFKTQILPKVSDVTIDEKPFHMTPIPWYPKQMAWKTNVDQKTFMKNKDLYQLKLFTLQEEKVFAIFKQDITSMIPPILVDISPNHKVLELKAGPGYNTAQILEQMLVNPKKTPDGVLVANDRDPNKIQYRWNRGTNVLYTHCEPDTFPDIYTTPEHTPESKLLYDRIFIDANTSNDGMMRTVPKLRMNWNVTLGQKSHARLKKELKRGVELLEINGQLVYKTTSLNPAENEAVVAGVLEEAKGALSLVNVKSRLPEFHVKQGMTEWKVMSQGLVWYDTYASSPAWFQKENPSSLFPPAENAASFNLDRCLRILPHDNDTEMLFVAVIVKTAQLPWLLEAEAAAAEKMETEGGGGDAKKEFDMANHYKHPIQCDVNVTCTGIQWDTVTTDEDLNSTVETETMEYEMEPMKISKVCIPNWVHKKLRESSAVYSDIAPDNPDWLFIKEELDIRKFDLLPNCMMFSHHSRNTVYYYCSPLLKKLIMSNPAVMKRSRSAGSHRGVGMFRSHTKGHAEIYRLGLLPLLPYINKGLVNVTKDDMILALENYEVTFDQFTPKTKTALEAMENGKVYLMYDPKGKNADPKCMICIQRNRCDDGINLLIERSKFNINPRVENSHHLRLCGIDPLEDDEEDQEEEDEDEYDGTVNVKVELMECE